MCNMQEWWLETELTMSGQSRTTSRRKLGIAYAWWNWTVRRPTAGERENQDQHKAHETRHLTWRCTKSSCQFWSVCVVILTHCTHIAWLEMSACSSHLIHARRERPLFDFELSIPSNFLLSFLINLKQFLLPFNFYEVQVVRSPVLLRQGDGGQLTSLSPT